MGGGGRHMLYLSNAISTCNYSACDETVVVADKVITGNLPSVIYADRIGVSGGRIIKRGECLGRHRLAPLLRTIRSGSRGTGPAAASPAISEQRGVVAPCRYSLVLRIRAPAD